MTTTQAVSSKPKYSLWQNFCFQHVCAWRSYKMCIFNTLAFAAADAGQTAVGMLVAPVVLDKVERAVPLAELLRAIAVFGVLIVLLAAVRDYLETNMYYRLGVRTSIMSMFTRKEAETSYPNTLDTSFLSMAAKANDTVKNNSAAVEHFWVTWRVLLTNILCFCVYLAIMSSLDPLLLAVIIAASVVGYFGSKRINEWGYRHKEEQAVYENRLRYFNHKAVGRECAKDLRIFGLKTWINDVWERTLNTYSAFIEKRERIYLWTSVVDLVLAFARNGAAYAYLLWLTLEGGLSAAQFLLYFSAVSGFSQWVTGILEQLTVLSKESAEISTLREFLDWPEPFKFEDGRPLKKDTSQPCELRLEHVSYRYPQAEADTIHDMDLTIRAGEKLAIVGLNGAGKTTLVKLLCGFLDPTEGRVLLNGEDIRQYNRWDYYNIFSAVFQEFSVLEESVAVNVAQQYEGWDEARVRSCLDEAGLTEKIASLPEGINTKVGREVYENGVEFSGGQTQRLMLARALYRDGAVLVLDEPTAALDPIAESDIYNKYNDMTRGKTSVFISHRLASTRFCDRILFLEHGAIAEQGTHEELLARGGKYADLFEVQSKYYREGSAHDGE